MLNRRFTLAVPKQIVPATVITEGLIACCHFSDDTLVPVVQSDGLSYEIALSALNAPDLQTVERFMVMLIRLTESKIANS